MKYIQKRGFYILAAICISMLFLGSKSTLAYTVNNTTTSSAIEIKDGDNTKIEKVKTYKVTAILRKDTKLFKRGDKVEVLKDKNMKTYYIFSSKYKKYMWVPANYLQFEKDSEVNFTRLTKDEIEGYVKNMTSKSGHLIWVDLDRQLTYILRGKKGEWKLVRTMQCSTGRNTSPTIKGAYTIKSRGNWFYSKRFAQGGQNWMKIDGAYLFHSLPMDKHKNIVDSTLGKRASHGCIRLSVEDSKWMYKNIPNSTTVYIN